MKRRVWGPHYICVWAAAIWPSSSLPIPLMFALHCTALLYTTLLYTALLTALHCTALLTALHCSTVQCSAEQCTVLHCTVLHCTALHCTLFLKRHHLTTLTLNLNHFQCITLQMTTPHYTLQYTIYLSPWHIVFTNIRLTQV